MEAARSKKGLDSRHGLGSPETRKAVSKELLKWSKAGSGPGSLFGLLALAWAAFGSITASLQEAQSGAHPLNAIIHQIPGAVPAGLVTLSNALPRPLNILLVCFSQSCNS